MKIIRSFHFAWKGIIDCFVTQINFRVHLSLAVLAIILGTIFCISGSAWMAIVFCIALVLITEMLNTALEKLCDVVHKSLHPQIRMVKDIAAAAVLISALASFITGLFIFLPPILHFIKTVGK